MFSTFLKSSVIHVLTKSIAQKSVKSKVTPPINTIIGALFSLHLDIFSSGTRSIKRISKKNNNKEDYDNNSKKYDSGIHTLKIRFQW